MRTRKIDGSGFRPPAWLSALLLQPVVALAVLAGPNALAAPALQLAVSLGPVSLPVYVAASEGFFDAEGVAVRLLPCSSGRQCLGQLMQGQADLATAAELLVALDAAKGGDAVIVATLSASAQPIKLVARRSAGIGAAADLRGKRIATIGGTSAQYFLDSWLVYHDVDPTAVPTRLLAAEQLLPALQRREIDAVAIWEPIASGAVQLLGDDAVQLPGASIYTQHFNLVSRKPVVAERAADIVKLLRALARSERFIADRPEQALRILAAEMRSLPGASMGGHSYKLGLGQSLITTMDAQVRWAAGQGLAPVSGPPPSLLLSIEPRLLRQVAPQAVSLVR